MKNYRLKIFNFVIFIVLFSFVSTASAAVVVSEIAWMGSADSASNEWIELFNDGDSAVNLSGWTLRIQGKKDIALKGSVASGGYYLIERTDDNTIPGISADLITPFGSGLSNDGATLVLLNAQGSEVGRVNGNDKWKIGGVETVGSITTKETAQRAGVIWVTAPATPRSVNSVSTVSTQVQKTTSTQSTSGAAVSTGGSSSSVAPQITVDVGPQTRIALVGAPVIFEGRVLVAKKEPTEKVGFIWNFNDGTPPVNSEKTSHVYSDVGEYWVTIQLDPTSGYSSEVYRIRVIVVVPNIALRTSGDSSRSFIEIENRSEYEIDLSGWQVSAGSRIFTFYPNTLLVARGAIKFGSDKTGLLTPVGTITELRFPNGTPVQLQSEIVPAPLIVPIPEKSIQEKIVSKPSTKTYTQVLKTKTQEASVVSVLPATTSSQIKNENKQRSMLPWYTGVAFFGALALLALRFTRSKSTLADEFEITEEK